MTRGNWMIQALLAVALATAGSAVAQQPAFEPALRLERDEGHPRAGFQFRVAPLQRRYRPNEPIALDVSGNRPFYLWAYTVDRDGRATVLAPGASESARVHEPDRRHRVPGSGHHFYADEPGPHQLILIASTRLFDLDRWLRRQGRKSGDRLTLPATEIEAAFAELGVRIGRDRPDAGGTPDPATAEAVVRYLDFEVAR